jgi:TRAP-type C4-dicarboxylate transport system substrate-binding protein
MRRHAALLAALALVVAGCGGSGGDKAGGRDETRFKPATPVGEPVTLTLVSYDDLWTSEFASAVRRLSGGTIRIERQLGGGALLDYELRHVARVRAGEADLVSVGARAWDRLGVTSFRALVAPLLIDSRDLERRVLESPLVQRMLEGVEPLGLVGLAVLPGPLHRPFGLSRPLVSPQDYAGAVLGIRYSGVARDSVRALGATAKAYRIGSLAGLDGAELDAWTIANDGYDAPGAKLTTNVVLWARPETIVISRDAFDRLPPAQREVLRRAGREALAPVLARIEKEQTQALEVICGRGNLTLASASPSELAALRTAVQPVYDELERDGQTREFISEIRKLGGGIEAESLRCPVSQRGLSQVDGVWEANVTREAMVANGASVAEAATYHGPGTLELRGRRWTFLGDRATVTGTYVVTGDALRLTMLTCTANPCSPGAATEYTWSVYRDELTLTRRSGRPFWPRLIAKPGRRAG